MILSVIQMDDASPFDGIIIRLLAESPPADRGRGRPAAVHYAQLSVASLQMGTCGVGADEQPRCDIADAQPLGCQAKDVELAWREPVSISLLQLEHHSSDTPFEHRRQDGPPSCRRPDRCDESSLIAAVEDTVVRPGH